MAWSSLSSNRNMVSCNKHVPRVWVDSSGCWYMMDVGELGWYEGWLRKLGG